jgi:Spy/CpxP family protein refolding chaperone
MKISKLGLLAALVLGGLVAGSTLATAQDAAPPAGKKRGAMGVEQQLERMTTELKLTDAQVPKVKALLEEGAKKRGELRDATPEERREKMTAMREEQDKKLKEILTPEQFEKWTKMRDEMRKKGGPGGEKKADAKADAKKN